MARSWTSEEDAIVREYYPRHGVIWDGWALLLPGRDEPSIRNHAQWIGVRYEGPSKNRGRFDSKTANERAAAAVAALGDWQATRLALLFAVAGKEVEW